MLTLFHAPRSRSSRIIWLLEELGSPFQLRYVTIRYMDGSGDGPDPANPHPDKKVPALLDNGALVHVVLAERLERAEVSEGEPRHVAILAHCAAPSSMIQLQYLRSIERWRWRS